VKIPDTHYVRNGEIAIAYQVHGEGRYDLVMSGSTASNLETVWHLPQAHELFERLGRFTRVIRFDRRDTGVSDPIRDDLTLEAHTADALAVMDAVAAERPVLFGGLDGSRSLAALAATRPERAAGLIAVQPSAKGGAAAAPELAAAISESLADPEWPRKLMPAWVPDAVNDPVALERFTRYVRTSTSPRQARRLFEMSLQSDITDVLPHVQCPSLVILPSGPSATLPPEPSREFADLIPGAHLREIPGGSAIMYALDVALLADIVEEFITGTAPAPVSNRVLATVLFTDLVDSTKRAAALGDRRWAELLNAHHRSAEDAVTRHGGRMVKRLGDGILATFAGPAQAVRCAQALRAAERQRDLEIRNGIHTGEVELLGDDVAGLAVHLAARIMDRAGAGEILVSRTVRDLVVGSELEFADRGEHELKGISERWQLYAVV
jgi:class 3 adenylate cyclase